MKNSIIDNDYNKNVDDSIVTHVKNAYEIIFHTVWGLKSLSRESKEQYNIEDSIMTWIYYPWEKSLTPKVTYREVDKTYLPHLQKYFDLDSVPFNTKSIYVFQKNNKKQLTSKKIFVIINIVRNYCYHNFARSEQDPKSVLAPLRKKQS